MKRLLALLFFALFAFACTGKRTTTDTLDTGGDQDATGEVQDSKCLLTNGEGTLEDQRCVLTTCYEGFENCDGDGSTGCEASLLGSTASCGACGVTCGDGETCVEGICTCGESTGDGGPACSEDGTACCGDACVPPTDPACACGDAPNCEEGELCCAKACSDPQLDTLNCGGCGVTCGEGETCAAGQCLCAAGLEDCDSDPGNGCETDLLTSETHCGGCGITCGQGETCLDGVCTCGETSPPEGTTTACQDDENGNGTVCCASTCVAPSDPRCACGDAPSCRAGESCCDSLCTPITEDDQNCGGCGIACAPEQTCEDGSCLCPSESPTLCGDDCTDTKTDTNNCGTCGNACDPGGTCSNGVCTCPSNRPLKCSDNTCVSESAANCGACGRACKAPPLGKAACIEGQCACGLSGNRIIGYGCPEGYACVDGEVGNRSSTYDLCFPLSSSCRLTFGTRACDTNALCNPSTGTCSYFCRPSEGAIGSDPHPDCPTKGDTACGEITREPDYGICTSIRGG